MLFFFLLPSAGEVADDAEMESGSGDVESDEEAEAAEVHSQAPKATELLSDVAPKLTKTQEKELNKIRNQDYSWILTL